MTQALNRECFCVSLDDTALAQALDADLGEPSLSELVRSRCPTLYAARPVFVDAALLARMQEVVQAVEAVVALPAWQEHVLSAAPGIARADAMGARGVFFGYDFHLAGDQLALIEINTNAGGALLNVALARAQRACCPAVEPWMPTQDGVSAFEHAIVEMFRAEWTAHGTRGPLSSIAIVDDDPQGQYLYPEFVLFQRLFARHGIGAVIADPAELAWHDGALWHGARRIDLVYNRLTDFYLDAPGSAALRNAYLAHAVVVTPHPRAHALYADKRHLALLSNPERLAALGAPEPVRRLLSAHVPRTEVVEADHAERLWHERRGLFFKRASGFGSRAAYRGDKITRRVWQEIVSSGDYVAQAFAAPGERWIDGDAGESRALKFDLRVYTYAGRMQWAAARLYQGQTTNFRTPGGGFAPVFTTRVRPPGPA